jgi:hypothetical protein
VNLLERFAKIDPRIIYALVLLVVAIPLINPFGLPMMIMNPSREFYNVIENLPNGAKVILSIDHAAGPDVELGPIAQSMLIQLVPKNARVYAMSSIPEGPMFAERYLSVLEDYDKEYGVDYVNLGYFAGGEAGMAAWADDFKSVFRTDVRKTPVEQIPMMQDIKSVHDFDLVVTLNSGPGGYGPPDVWLRQIAAAKGVPLAMGVTAIMGPQTQPYYQSGQIKGLLIGLRSAAEYELLIEKPGIAVAQMDAQSAAHAVILILIILGNLGYFYGKRSTRGESD